MPIFLSARPSSLRFAPGSLVLAALVAAGCAFSPHQRPPEQCQRLFEVPVAASEQALELRVANGRVTVADGAVASCVVDVCVRAASKEEAERCSEAVRLIPDADDDGTRVVTVQTPNALAADGLTVVIAVTAPPALAVRVLTRQAAVMVHGYRGRLTVDTDSGDVAARMAGGEVEIKARSGEVKLSGTFASARVQAEGGPVQVVLPGGASTPRLDVQTLGSDVTVELPHDIAVDFSARLRNAGNVPCELAASWTEYAADAGDRWRSYRGRIGPADAGGRDPSVVHITSDRGRVALRRLPGSQTASELGM